MTQGAEEDLEDDEATTSATSKNMAECTTFSNEKGKRPQQQLCTLQNEMLAMIDYYIVTSKRTSARQL